MHIWAQQFGVELGLKLREKRYDHCKKNGMLILPTSVFKDDGAILAAKILKIISQLNYAANPNKLRTYFA